MMLSMAHKPQVGFILTRKLTNNHEILFNYQKDKNEKTHIYPNCINGRFALSGSTGTTGSTIHTVHVQYERGEPCLCRIKGKSFAYGTVSKPMVRNGGQPGNLHFFGTFANI